MRKTWAERLKERRLEMESKREKLWKKKKKRHFKVFTHLNKGGRKRSPNG